nr:uncharacterized protein LOC117850228 [Setaria viridis]
MWPGPTGNQQQGQQQQRGAEPATASLPAGVPAASGRVAAAAGLPAGSAGRLDAAGSADAIQPLLPAQQAVQQLPPAMQQHHMQPAAQHATQQPLYTASPNWTPWSGSWDQQSLANNFSTMTLNPPGITEWVLDSSASNHITPETGSSFQDVIVRCNSSEPLYSLHLLTSPPTLSALVATAPPSTTWHRHLGHPGLEALSKLISTTAITCNKGTSDSICHTCQLGRHIRLPFHNSSRLLRILTWFIVICGHPLS